MGVRALMALASVRSSSNPHSCAMAGRCSIEFVEQPSAMSTVSAFSNASFVMMSRGQMLFFTSSITARPASLARR